MTTDKLTRRAALGVAAAVTVAPAIAASEPGQEKVQGIGGFFFRAHDPRAVAKWYADNLGISLVPTAYDQTPWRQEAGTTIFGPFKQDTKYFGDMKYQWMINFRVSSLDKMAAQLTANGIEVEIDPATYPNGRFALLHDPEGNPIQLWQPGGVDRG